MFELLLGIPTRVWGLLLLIVVVPLAGAVVTLWTPAGRRLGLATRLAGSAVAVMGIGFGAMALVATLAVLQTGLQEIRRRHLTDIVELADDLSNRHLQDPDGSTFERSLSLFRALQPEIGPVAVWGMSCGTACLSVAVEPRMADAARSWAERLIANPPTTPALRTVTLDGEMHLVVAAVLRAPTGGPEGYVAVAIEAGWVASRALQTAVGLVGIAYLGLIMVGFTTRGMLATTVAARVSDIVGRLRSSTATPPGGALSRDHADELAALESAVSRHIVQTVERLRDADQQASEARALAARMEATATLAAGVAHDFSNLMSGVMANCELLRQDLRDSPEALGTLETVWECAQRGGLLAQQLVAFARGGKYQPAVVDLNAVVREALRVEAAPVPDIAVTQDLAPTLPAIEADAVQLAQVVSNLYRNAVDAVRLGAGRGTVRIRTGLADLRETRDGALADLPAGRYVTLTVADTGAGMSEETRARIFEPFFTTKESGRGMGLAATYGIVTHHGGGIAVASEVGQGTVFTVFLPATDAAAGTPPPAPDEPPAGATVLVVDDEAPILSATRRLLERLGFTVLTAESGPEAIQLAQHAAGAIHVILLDLRMPGMSGSEAFDALVAARPDARVVLCSGYEFDDQAQALLARGAAAFVRKPFGIAELTEAVTRAAAR